MDGYVHPDFAKVATRLTSILDARGSTGGAAVAVYHRGDLVVDMWGGTRDSTGTPWERDTMAMSFSTTKGVVATVVHRLVDRGDLSYNAPVATYWPEFAAADKENVTLRDLLSHRAALHAIRPLVSGPEELFDWDLMVSKLEDARPAWAPGRQPGYHALTYGWLVGEVIRRVTGLTVNDAVQRELAGPLEDDGLYIGALDGVRSRVAELIVDPRAGDRMSRMAERMQKRERFRPFVDALVVDGLMDYLNSDQILGAELPAANGVFTARGLAKMYAALVTPDVVDGPPLVSAETVRSATVVQTGRRDAVLLFPMRWRLGYHLAATTAGVPPQGFGHFGFGGSGAWADPATGLAVAMVLNQVGSGAPSDTRLLRVGAAALRAARRRDEHLN